MNLAVPNGDVAGPKATVVPTGRVTAWRIVSLYFIETLFRFVNAVAMNSIAPGIQLLSGSVAIVWIGKDVETIDNDSARKMKTNVIENDSVFRLGPNSQWILRIVAIDAHSVGSTGNIWTRVSRLQLVGKSER